MKINLENMQGIFHFGLKILCDGYVTAQGLLKDNRLKINPFLYDGYVTEQKIKILSGINFLFDWKSSSTTKKVLNDSFSINCLFDGYLTEITSYPHFEQMAYLTGGCLAGCKTNQNALFSSISLFDGYLTEHNKWQQQLNPEPILTPNNETGNNKLLNHD
ncbi:MAG: hypothetical protein ACK56P_07735 [Chitinophagales bacterium]|jgi:hypothetical protein